MKIALLAPDKKTEKGIALYSEELYDALKSAGLDADLVTYHRGSLKSLIKASYRLRKYDIVHIQHEGRLFGPLDGIYFPLFTALLSLLKKGRVVTTMHTIHTKDEKIYSINRLLTPIKKFIMHPLHNILINALSSKIVVHTDFLKDDLLQTSTIKNKKIAVIPHGAKQNVPTIDRQEAKKKLGISNRLYLMIGNIGPVKGIDIIVKEAEKIGQTIAVVGTTAGGMNDSYLQELKQFVREKGLENTVIFDVNSEINAQKQVWWDYLSAADLVLMPYRTMTTSGIFISAMEAGVPVIGCNSRYFKEIAAKYNCIVIAETDSDYPRAIESALQKIETLRQEALRFAKENSINEIANEYKILYETIMTKGI